MKVTKHLFAAMAVLAIVCGCKCKTNCKGTEEEAAPEEASYTDIEPKDAVWLHGVWQAPDGNVLMLFDNGTYEMGYDVANNIGTYVMMDENEIILYSTYNALDENAQEIDLILDKSTGKLGDFIKQEFINDYETEGGGYGLITEVDFSVAAEANKEMVESDKNPFKD